MEPFARPDRSCAAGAQRRAIAFTGAAVIAGGHMTRASPAVYGARGPRVIDRRDGLRGAPLPGSADPNRAHSSSGPRSCSFLLNGRAVFHASVDPERQLGCRLALPVARISRLDFVLRVRSSVFVPQFEGEGHGHELRVAVPHQLRAGRVACAAEPPAEAPDQSDSVAEARRRRQRA